MINLLFGCRVSIKRPLSITSSQDTDTISELQEDEFQKTMHVCNMHISKNAILTKFTKLITNMNVLINMGVANKNKPHTLFLCFAPTSRDIVTSAR